MSCFAYTLHKLFNFWYVRALYVSSSTPQANQTPVLLLNNETNGKHSPVFVATDLNNFVGKDGAGDMIKQFISKWRTESRFINGYEVSNLVPSFVLLVA